MDIEKRILDDAVSELEQSLLEKRSPILTELHINHLLEALRIKECSDCFQEAVLCEEHARIHYTRECDDCVNEAEICFKCAEERFKDDYGVI